MKRYQLIPVSAIGAAFALVLAGCGGSDTPSGGAATQASISGTVADGYLVGATVCLDKNDNSKCDADEPGAVTKARGAYTLAVNSDDAAKYSIVAEIAAGTIDEDTNAAVAKPYVLTAPPGALDTGGKVNVTPMTTLVQNAIDQAPGLSPAEAEKAVKVQLGYPANSSLSLFENYIEKKAADPEYKRIHQIAQVTAGVLGENKEALASAAGGGVAVANLTKEISYQSSADTLANLAKIVAIADDSTNFDDKGVAKSGEIASAITDNSVATSYNEASATSAIANAQAVAKATVSNIVTAAKDGLHSFNVQPEQGAFKFSRNAMQANAEGTQLSSTEELYSNSSWNAESHHNSLVLIKGIWTTSNDEVMNIKVQPDGSVNFNAPDGSGAGNARMSEIDISGRNIADFINPSALKNAPGTFGPGAKAYLFTLVSDADNYYIDQWTDCGNQQMVAGSCNVITKGFGANGQSTGYVVALAELLKVSDTNRIQIGSDGNLSLSVVFSGGATGAVGESGTASFYTGSAGKETQVPTSTLSGTGGWKIVDVGGQAMLQVEIPAALQSVNGNGGKGETLFFAEQGGAVRRGSLTHMGVPSSNNGNGISRTADLNGIAYQNILNALDLGKSFSPTKEPLINN